MRTHITPAYRVARIITSTVYRILFRVRIEGAERIPATGRVILAANHQSFLDIPLVAMTTRRHVAFVARDTLAASKPLAWLMDQCGAVLVRRGAGDRAALRQMVAHLEAEDALVVFPEGTRTRDGRVAELRAGVRLTARQAGAPVLPVGIRGAFRAWPRDAKLPRPRRIGVRFGELIEPDRPDLIEALAAQLDDLVGDGLFESTPPRSSP